MTRAAHSELIDRTATGVHMPKVFINYRSNDAGWAALLQEKLLEQFSGEDIFLAGQTVNLGEDFSTRILTAVRDSAVLLAVIGPRWLARDASGHRRKPVYAHITFKRLR